MLRCHCQAGNAIDTADSNVGRIAVAAARLFQPGLQIILAYKVQAVVQLQQSQVWPCKQKPQLCSALS